MNLQEALDTSEALAEKLADARDNIARESLFERKSLVDYTAFQLFKQADFGRALQWGAGLGLPALGVGHMLMRDARSQGHEMLADARNQALITAAGVGGMQALGNTLGNAFAPQPQQQPQSMPQDAMKLSSADGPTLRKLAAVLTLDVFLCDQVEKTAGAERDDALECLMINRSCGADLLRSLR